jgi:hypothetical protein
LGPTNYAAYFLAHIIVPEWTDATWEMLPHGYLVSMSATSFDDITATTNGSPNADNFWH